MTKHLLSKRYSYKVDQSFTEHNDVIAMKFTAHLLLKSLLKIYPRLHPKSGISEMNSTFFFFSFKLCINGLLDYTM